MAVLALMILCIYSALIGLGLLTWNRVIQAPVNHSIPSGQSISIIIPYRNEARSLPQLLSHLDRQDLDPALWTCFFVNDHSEDEGPQMIASRLKPNYRMLDAIGSGKKNAIKTALASIETRSIVQTDADCLMGEAWLSSYQSLAGKDENIFCTAPVVIVQPLSILDHLQMLEMMALMGMTLAGIESGRWYMANGANMYYSRELAIRHYSDKAPEKAFASGDDMGLVYAAASEPNYKIKFNLHPDSIVTTPSINGMNHLISQRLRWSTKNYSSKDGGMKVALTIALSINVTNVLLVILTLFYPFLFPATLMMWVSKLTIDYLYLKSMSSFYHYGMPVGKYLLSSLIYPFYISFVFILSIFKRNYEWKGRIAR